MATKEMSEPATCSTVCGNAALSGCRQSGGEQERDQQQKTDPNYRGQRNEIGPDELPEPADLFFVDLPHGIESVLELNDDAERGKQQHGSADYSREQALLRLVGIGEHAVDRGRRGLADHSRKLALHFAARRLLAEY